MPKKHKEQLRDQLRAKIAYDLGIMAYYFSSVHGFPLEIFEEEMAEKNFGQQMVACASFRKEHPELFKA